MKKRTAEFIKSTAAGVMISIGGAAFLSCENRYVGALLFCVGLISVVALGFNLYTGKIGYVLDNDGAFFADTLLSVIGNFVGCLAVGLLLSPVGNVTALTAAKLEKGLLTTFINAVMCGLLIYVCVEIYKRKNTFVGILFCVPTFILCGFEHSVADMFYFINAGNLSGAVFVFLLTVIAGNAVGGLFFPFLAKIKNKLEKQ